MTDAFILQTIKFMNLELKISLPEYRIIKFITKSLDIQLIY